MHIQNVVLKDCTFSPETRRFQATLLMDADARRMHMRAQANYYDGMRRDDMMKYLLEDALRQLRRMPEFRYSTQPITIAENALPQGISQPQAV